MTLGNYIVVVVGTGWINIHYIRRWHIVFQFILLNLKSTNGQHSIFSKIYILKLSVFLFESHIIMITSIDYIYY